MKGSSVPHSRPLMPIEAARSLARPCQMTYACVAAAMQQQRGMGRENLNLFSAILCETGAWEET